MPTRKGHHIPAEESYLYRIISVFPQGGIVLTALQSGYAAAVLDNLDGPPTDEDVRRCRKRLETLGVDCG